MLFDTKYQIASMNNAINNSIEIKLKESSVIKINWIGEKAISFFKS